jgi:serine/threonine protein phosphatase PrpC
MNRSVQGREHFSVRGDSLLVTAEGDELGLEIAGLSDAGLVRRENQDALGYRVPDPATRREHGALFVLCDGIGTLTAGQDASDLAVTAFTGAFYAAPPGEPDQMLRRAAAHANAELLRARSHYESGARLGTTLVSVLIRRRHYYVLNIGDSRAYICRGGDLRQVSRDHGLVYGHDTGDRRISRALGVDPQIRPDVFGPHPLAPGDDLLLCSDGLTTSVSEAAIGRVISRSRPAEAASLLVERAKTAGGRDNVTVLLVRIGVPGTAAPACSTGGVTARAARLRSLGWDGVWQKISPTRALSDGGWRTPRGLLIGALWLLGVLAIGLAVGRLLSR